MGWVRLGDVCLFIRNGKSIKQFGDEGYPITRIETIANRNIDEKRVGYASIFDLENYQDYLLQSGDILMSHINSSKHLGKSAIFESDNIIIHGMNLLMIRPNVQIALPKFIYYALNSDFFKRQIPKITKNSVNQSSFTVSNLKTLKIPVPSLETQEKIVQVLDNAQSLIDNRKEQIALLDKLTESIFYEMFGDPIKNEKGWEMFKIGDCFDVKTGKTPSRKNLEYWSNPTINWVKTTEIVNGIIYKTDEKISRKAVDDLNLPIFKKGNILIAMYGQGATRGRVSKINIDTTTNQACAGLINSKGDSVNEEYIFRFLILSYENLRMLGRGGNQPNLNLDIIKRFVIPIPPLPLQNQFAEKVEEIEKQKKLLQDSLELLEDNYKALMQRAFKGELFD